MCLVLEGKSPVTASSNSLLKGLRAVQQLLATIANLANQEQLDMIAKRLNGTWAVQQMLLDVVLDFGL